MARQVLFKLQPVADQNRCVAVQVIGHGGDVCADCFTVFLEIGTGHLIGFFKGRTDPFAEPGLQSKIEEQGRKNGDQDGRGNGHQGKKHHQLDVQSGTGLTAPPFHPHADKAAGYDGAQEDQQNGIEIQQTKDSLRVWTVGRRSRHGGNSGDPGQHRNTGQQVCKLTVEPVSSGPQLESPQRLPVRLN